MLNALVDTNINRDEFISVKNVLKECNEMKKIIKNYKIFNLDNI